MSIARRADDGGMETAVTHTNSQGALAAALAELGEGTARLVDLRHKVEHLAAGVAEQRRALGELERDLSALSASADADRALVAGLESDVDGREQLFAQLRNEIAALAAELNFGGAR